MASDELRRLWRLHQIDSALVEIQAKAAGLDPGRRIIAEVRALETKLDEKGGQARELAGELTDLELKQKSIEDKLKKIDKDLYGGSVVNPREVENLEKEVATLKKHRSELDGRILQLWELVPPAQAEADEIESQITAKKKELSAHQKQALRLKALLEEEYRDRTGERPAAVKAVSAGLLARYDAIRKSHHGTAMAEITRKRTCSACGTLLPERTVQAARDDKLVTCDECHRILYHSDGVV